MKAKNRSIEKIIEEQVQRWQLQQAKKEEEKFFPVITISREPGSGGRSIAEKLSEKFGLSLFHQEVVHEMAENAQVSTRLLAFLDEKAQNVLDEWIASLVDAQHLWPDRYLRHLMKIIGTIGKHGKAVIVGRGANFVLAPEKCFRLRVVAPMEVRVKNVSQAFDVSTEDARRRVIRTESDRKAFIRKYFNANIADPMNYDMIINTGTVSVDCAVDAIAKAIGEIGRASCRERV